MKKNRELFDKNIRDLKSLLESCTLCPRKCGVNRSKGEKGFCRAGINPAVYSCSPHHGEEPPLSGTSGSGTIFFTHCNMACSYCQNYNFSQLSDNGEMTVDELSSMMMNLERLGCHNINLVSPTHYASQIAESILQAKGKGLSLPIVYNTGGYDSPDVIGLLEGLIDIYMPDMRYSDNKMAVKYSNAPFYVETNRACVMEMQKQGGDLVLDPFGIAKKGLIIRCLILPDNRSGTEKTLEFIANSISKKAYISLMSQYYPIYKATNFEELSRRITDSEYKRVVDKLEDLGLNNGWLQASPSGMNVDFGGHKIKRRR